MTCADTCNRSPFLHHGMDALHWQYNVTYAHGTDAYIRMHSHAVSISNDGNLNLIVASQTESADLVSTIRTLCSICRRKKTGLTYLPYSARCALKKFKSSLQGREPILKVLFTACMSDKSTNSVTKHCFHHARHTGTQLDHCHHHQATAPRSHHHASSLCLLLNQSPSQFWAVAQQSVLTRLQHFVQSVHLQI